MDIERLVIAKPSGNITALVFDEIAPEKMREVGEVIQSEYPSVEQVLFVQKRGDLVHAQMAGGEFCGNAARALGYVLADGKESTQTFTMSGLSKPISVDVKTDYAKLRMQTAMRHEKVKLGNSSVSVVHLEGISHAVMEPKHPLFYFLKEYAARPDRWGTVKHVLDDLGLSTQPAAGLIFAEKNGVGTKITPYVFVRDIETLYAETACASGSLATASVLGKNTPISQPSGETLGVSLKPNGRTVKAEVEGSMAILSDGPVKGLYATPRVDRGVAVELAQAIPQFPAARAG